MEQQEASVRQPSAEIIEFIPRVREIPALGGLSVRIEHREDVLRVSILDEHGRTIDECSAFTQEDDDS